MINFARRILFSASWIVVIGIAAYVVGCVYQKPPEVDLSSIPRERINGPPLREAIRLLGGNPDIVED